MDLLLTAANIKRFLYILIVISAAYLLCYHTRISNAHWLIWSSLFFASATLCNQSNRKILTVLLAGFIAVLTTVVATFLANWLLLLALYLALITFAAVYVGRQHPDYYLFAFTTNLFTILAAVLALTSHHADTSWQYILVGACVAAFGQAIYLYHFKQDEQRIWLLLALNRYKQLVTDIFATLLVAEYSTNIYLFERRIHEDKSRCMQALLKLQVLAQCDELLVYERVETIYNNLIDIAQLRRRVSDCTIFQVCDEELSFIASGIQSALSQLKRLAQGKNVTYDPTMLATGIMKFEGNYQQVLQVAAREPLVFLLFIDSLKTLSDNVEMTAKLLRKEAL